MHLQLAPAMTCHKAPQPNLADLQGVTGPVMMRKHEQVVSGMASQMLQSAVTHMSG